MFLNLKNVFIFNKKVQAHSENFKFRCPFTIYILQ